MAATLATSSCEKTLPWTLKSALALTGSQKRAQHLLVGRIEAGGSGFEENLNNAVNHFKLLWVPALGGVCSLGRSTAASLSRVSLVCATQHSVGMIGG